MSCDFSYVGLFGLFSKIVPNTQTFVYISNVFPEEFVENLIFQKIASIVIVFQLIYRFIQHSSPKYVLFVQSSQNSLHFSLSFHLESLIFVGLKFRDDLLLNFLPLMQFMDFSQRSQQMFP